MVNKNGRRLSFCSCGHSILVIYHPISSKFHIWTTSIKLLFMSAYVFVRWTIIKIVAKTDIPFSLQGIMRGPLSESDCSISILALPLMKYTFFYFTEWNKCHFFPKTWISSLFHFSAVLTDSTQESESSISSGRWLFYCFVNWKSN